MAVTEKPNNGKSTFGSGLKAELLGLATRDGVSALNLENLVFGTIGHLIIGVSITKLLLKATGHKQKGVIRGILPKGVANSSLVSKLDVERPFFGDRPAPQMAETIGGN